MGRPRAKIDTHGEADEVLDRLRGAKGWQRERLLVIKRALEGAGTVELAKKMSRSHTTIQDWIDRFREGGIERLLSKEKGNGPQSALTAEMQKALEVELAKGRWRTAGEAWKWLEQHFDMSAFSESSIYYILGKCGGRLKVARPSNPKKDPEKEKEFRTTLAEKLKELNLPARRPDGRCACGSMMKCATASIL